MNPKRQPLSLPALCGVVFASGASALIFETLWFRLAGLAFGNSLWATSVVLASFMGGLGIGNGLAGRYGHRPAHPVRAYGVLELVIGASGLALVLLFPILNHLMVPLYRALEGSPLALDALRLGSAFVLMLLPAAAMGATLPMLVRELCSRDLGFGGSLGNARGGIAESG